MPIILLKLEFILNISSKELLNLLLILQAGLDSFYPVKCQNPNQTIN